MQAVRFLVVALLTVMSAGCSGSAGGQRELGDRERAAIADSLRSLLESTYRFDGDSIIQRFMSIYPDSGRVVSAASGGFTTTRDSLEQALAAFWQGAGQYMRHPTWEWDEMVVDVLARNAATVTARYRIPHWTPDGNPHVIGGAWTSVWVRRDGRWVIVQEHLSDLPRPIAERYEASMPRLADDTTHRHP